MTADRVENLLQRTHRLLRATGLATRAMQLTCWLVAALLVAVGVDAVAGLPLAGLLAIDLLLLALAATIAASLVRVLYHGRFHARRVARTIESRLALPGSRLINAIELSQSGGNGTSAALAALAVRQGNEAAESIEPGTVVQWAPVKRSAIRAGIAAAAALIALVAAPGVFSAVLPRMIDPFGDHPPFTLLNFDIAIEPDAVYHGKPAAITATLTGPVIPDKAEVVFVNDDGLRQRVLMLRGVSGATQAGHFIMRLDRAEQSRTFYIDTPQGRSRRHHLLVRPVPRFEKIHVTYEFPAYTGWDSVQQPIESSGIRALDGTRATITVHSNVPLAGGELSLSPGSTSPLAPHPDHANQAIGIFTITENAHLTATLRGIDGTPGHEPFSCPVVCVPDELPRIHVAEPEPRLIVPEGWIVDVEVRATDDIALDRMLIHRSVNHWSAIPAALQMTWEGAGRTRASARDSFDLTMLGARAGDVIHYFATAYDTHPSGEHFADTPVHVIQVITEAEYLEYERTRYRIDDITAEWEAYQAKLAELEEMRRQILEQLAELQKKLDAGQPLADQEKLAMAQLESALAQYADKAAALAQQMQERSEQLQLYEFEEPYNQMMAELAAALRSQADAAGEVEAASGQLQQQDTADARAGFAVKARAFRELQAPFDAESQQEQEQVAQDLEAMRLADELIAQGERIRMVAAEQADLAQRMAAFKNQEQLSSADQIRAQRMAQEQAALEQELADAAQRLRAAAEAAQEKLPSMAGGAMKIADAIDALQIPGDMADMQKLATAGEGRYAYEAARSAADKLDSLLSDCNSMGGQAESDLDGCFNLPRERMRESMQQMAQGRGVPGLGQRGGDGSGFAGSNARMGIRGPASRGGPGGAEGRQSGTRGDGKGGVPGDVEILDPAESLSPEHAATRGGGTGVLPGVPLLYREEAEAYFQRLADDSRGSP